LSSEKDFIVIQEGMEMGASRLLEIEKKKEKEKSIEMITDTKEEIGNETEIEEEVTITIPVRDELVLTIRSCLLYLRLRGGEAKIDSIDRLERREMLEICT